MICGEKVLETSSSQSLFKTVDSPCPLSSTSYPFPVQWSVVTVLESASGQSSFKTIKDTPGPVDPHIFPEQCTFHFFFCPEFVVTALETFSHQSPCKTVEDDLGPVPCTSHSFPVQWSVVTVVETSSGIVLGNIQFPLMVWVVLGVKRMGMNPLESSVKTTHLSPEKRRIELVKILSWQHIPFLNIV